MANPSTEFHMLREIFEQPDALAATLQRYVDERGFRPDTTGAAQIWLKQVDDILIVASGSSRHAGLAAELMFEELSGIHIDVEYASEYIHRSDASLRHTAVIVISQSGETADTLAALRKAKQAGKSTLVITNVLNSSMAVEADVAFPTLAGLERAIPATKSFTTQLLALWLLAMLAAKTHGTLSEEETAKHLAAARKLPSIIQAELDDWRNQMEQVAASCRTASGFLYLGRAIHYSIAREGALKLKEAAYVPAEGYPGGELKHGPNALVGSSLPLVMVATVDRADTSSVERYEKTIQLMRDMRAQGATILAIANRGDQSVVDLATRVVFVTEASEPLLAIQEIIPLQLFAFYMAIGRSIDVDHPRNLVKSVVVE